MQVVQMTHLLVTHGERPRPPRLQPIAEVDNFLSAHVERLWKNANARDAPPPAHFLNEEACQPFDDLLEGDDQTFLAAAHSLACRLVARMNKVTKPGLLVAVKAQVDANDSVAGVLKLQVDAENGAMLRQFETGELQLEAVKDLLDRPGRLQKGALVSTLLDAGRAVCGDLQRNAHYFPAALGLIVHPRPLQAAKHFFDAMDEVDPALTGLVAEAFAECRPGPVVEVLEEIAAKVEGLTGSVRAEVEARLRGLAQPVFELDTGQDVKEKYPIGSVTVLGPIADMRHLVRKERTGDGRWQLVIEIDEEPVGAWV